MKKLALVSLRTALVTALVTGCSAGSDGQMDTGESTAPGGSAAGVTDSGGTTTSGANGTTGAKDLLAAVQKIVGEMKTTHYQHDSNVDPATGVFDVDCSGFVDYALGLGVADAYTVFKDATVARPVAESFTTFFDELAPPKGRWHEVQRVKDLVPGDMIAWRIPAGVKSSDTGHVMIVEIAPSIASGSDQAVIGVIDSTDTGHGDVDPRNPKGPNGIGRGTIVLMMASDGTASGYRWSTDSDSGPYTTDVEMAHLD